MDTVKSLDEVTLIATLITDVSKRHGLVFNTHACLLTIKKLRKRARQEGMGFITKTLPKLGKAFDRALSGGPKLNATSLGFKPMIGCEFPRFLGELFSKVLDSSGGPLPSPDTDCVKDIRQILYLFYKYKLPYTDEQEQQVIQKFERTEADLAAQVGSLPSVEEVATYTAWRAADVRLQNRTNGRAKIAPPMGLKHPTATLEVVRVARKILANLFRQFDPLNIVPRHGPGAVSTRERLWTKYQWTNVSGRIAEMYPIDAYFYASLGHVCDRFKDIASLSDKSHPARVILVPKDSRGPRLISCEPVDHQWIQQGLGRAIVELVETHPSTKCQVNFTHQTPNRIAALWGSTDGRYSTLDLNEASDRVSLALVRLLFPSEVLPYLECCRSSSTVLPCGKEVALTKFAPMGSALCFPILALTVYAILAASAPDAYTRERILVYGDDVIVPTAFAGDAIEQLESFGLKVNRDKSCTGGLFRESCGMDAFKGTDVTPVRIRTVWSSHPAADTYASWIAYANSMWRKNNYETYDYIVSHLHRVYGAIPERSDVGDSAPALDVVSETHRRNIRKRWNKALHRVEYHVRCVSSPKLSKELDGWSMLLRYFSETCVDGPFAPRVTEEEMWNKRFDLAKPVEAPFSVRQYTERRTSKLVRRWR